MGMLIERERQKLIQSVVFFAHNTRKLGKTKLYKLLYFLDFTHFRDTGRPVTGLQYYAWPKGPVPVKLHNEIQEPADDWKGKCAFERIPLKNGAMLAVKAKDSFDPSLFSRRELKIMKQLAAEFYESTADEMVERTHLENLPWHQIYEVEQRKQDLIPYMMSLREQDVDLMVGAIKDRAEMVTLLRK